MQDRRGCKSQRGLPDRGRCEQRSELLAAPNPAGRLPTRPDDLLYGPSPNRVRDGDEAVGPVLLSADKYVYINLGFFDQPYQVRSQWRPVRPGICRRPWYGHDVQDLRGLLDRIWPNRQGATSASVGSELQADCYAGAWANHVRRRDPSLASRRLKSTTHSMQPRRSETIESRKSFKAR